MAKRLVVVNLTDEGVEGSEKVVVLESVNTNISLSSGADRVVKRRGSIMSN